MFNIYSFMLHTIEITLIAIFLFIIKYIFKDKLSPKWQYASWSILFIRMLIPTGLFNKYFSINIAIYLETIKTLIEKTLNSNYIKPYETIKLTNILPTINKLPSSITDYLFVFYILGVIICLTKYIIQYIKIKHLVKNENNELNKVKQTALKYNLKPCNTVLIEEIPTAFVFGIFKPILIIPNEDVDEKIILHELIHVKNHDGFQSIIWSILFTLHWCNPFMHYVLKQIKNDMEALCDQEVLEKVSGEERRDYGRILLAMCSDSYASAFGTTSISNGTKQIKTRIESIIRFKKYPKGIGLVSICILILLLPLGISGQAQAKFNANFTYNSNFDYEFALARGRLVECSTVAGAIDTFVKGLNQTNEEYIMSVTSYENRSHFKDYYNNLPFDIEIEKEMYNLAITNNYLYNYYVLNTNENNGVYETILALHKDGTFKDATGADVFEYIPIKIFKEDGYKVEINGDITYQVFENNKGTILSDIVVNYPYQQLNIECESGNLDIKLFKTARVSQNTKDSQNNINSILFDRLVLNKQPDPHARFEYISSDAKIIYTSTMEDVYHVGIVSAPLSYELEDFSSYLGDEGGSDSNGLNYTFKSVNENWNKELVDYISNYKDDINFKEEPIKLTIYKNHKVNEELVIRW